MPSKLVGVRLPAASYRRLQLIRRARRLPGDAETIRRLIDEYPLGLGPLDMPVFSAPIRSMPERRRRPRRGSREVDAVVYGP